MSGILNSKRLLKTLASTPDEENRRARVMSELTRHAHEIKDELNQSVSQKARSMEIKKEFLEQGLPEPNSEEIADLIIEVDQKAEQLIDQQEDRSEPSRSEYDSAKLALDNFKSIHDRPEDPVVDDSNIYHYAIIAAILLGETAINAVYFGQANERGLIGGTLEALAFAFLNVAVATLCGSAFKMKNHIRETIAIWGWVILAAFLMFTLFYNLGVGHYRSALASILNDPNSFGLVEATQEGWKNFTSSPFGVGDTSSITLVIMGYLIAVVSFIKALRYEDQYPGYAEVGRRLNLAKEQLRSKRDSNLKNLDDIYRHGKMGLTTLQMEVNKPIEEFRMTLLELATTYGQLDPLTQERQEGFIRDAREFTNKLDNLIFTQPNDGWPLMEVAAREIKPTNPPEKPDTEAAEKLLQERDEQKAEYDQKVSEARTNLENDKTARRRKIGDIWQI